MKQKAHCHKVIMKPFIFRDDFLATVRGKKTDAIKIYQNVSFTFIDYILYNFYKAD